MTFCKCGGRPGLNCRPSITPTVYSAPFAVRSVVDQPPHCKSDITPRTSTLCIFSGQLIWRFLIALVRLPGLKPGSVHGDSCECPRQAFSLLPHVYILLWVSKRLNSFCHRWPSRSTTGWFGTRKVVRTSVDQYVGSWMKLGLWSTLQDEVRWRKLDTSR